MARACSEWGNDCERWGGHTHAGGMLFALLFAFLSGFEVRTEALTGLCIPLAHTLGIPCGAGEAYLQQRPGIGLGEHRERVAE